MVDGVSNVGHSCRIVPGHAGIKGSVISDSLASKAIMVGGKVMN